MATSRLQTLVKILFSADNSNCSRRATAKVNLALASIDGVIAATAFFQFLRLWLHRRKVKWTRQMVFHFLIGAANAGYSLYFILNLIGTKHQWQCWPHACGFVAMALPQIIFLSTFLLLLSFWVDLCHEHTDKEDEEEDDEEVEQVEYQELPGDPSTKHGKRPTLKTSRRCHCWRRWRVRGRQKFLVVVVISIFVLTGGFALLIWIGKGKNTIDSATVVQIYSDLFAIVMLLSGGGLAAYGLLLYTKMSRVRSRTKKSSTDIKKVAGLAVASVLCFSLRGLLVLLTEVHVFKTWCAWNHGCVSVAVVSFLYNFIGETIPSVVVLWVMGELPPPKDNIEHSSMPNSRNGFKQTIVADAALMNHWIIPINSESYAIVTGKKHSPPVASEASSST
ncbi:hypothetical protein O6H91_20G067900 [Diphasiastrum complanatum]|uniref:Uncharacterized protein n=1 Tax=Diphasiastrum complanatum TaxID=34168 RepID=A0ACC2ARG1_DIPCM|nr:hypothetical protein O6H91_20G067900 [Diphasiastrum complanatum]